MDIWTREIFIYLKFEVIENSKKMEYLLISEQEKLILNPSK